MTHHAHAVHGDNNQSLFTHTWPYIVIGALIGALIAAGAFATQTHRWVDSRWPEDSSPERAVKYLDSMGITLSEDDMDTVADTVCEALPDHVHDDYDVPTDVWQTIADEKGDAIVNAESFNVHVPSAPEGEENLPADQMNDTAALVTVEAAAMYACPQYLPDVYAHAQQK